MDTFQLISRIANKMNWLDFEQKLNKKGQRIFTPLDVARIMDKSEVAVKFFLHRYTKRGALVYLKKGFYAFIMLFKGGHDRVI